MSESVYRESRAALEEQIKTLQTENARIEAECESLKSRLCWHSNLPVGVVLVVSILIATTIVGLYALYAVVGVK